MLNINPFNLICVIVNILVLYLIVHKLLIKRVMGTIQKRQDMIEDGFNKARKAESDAMQMKDQYEEKLKTARDESSKIIADARQIAQSEQNRIVSAADKQAKEIIEKAQKTIELEKQKTIQSTESEIAALAMLAAAKIMGGKDAGDDSELYEQFVKKAGDVNDAGSH